MKIKEIIVVEGRDDSVAIKRAVDADTIETNGSAINKETLTKIKHAQGKRGVIIFTDPDYPGEKIRRTIEQAVSGCKHAFIKKQDAMPKKGKGIGVEHASPLAIRSALKDAYTMQEEAIELISQEDLISAGLIAGPLAKQRRVQLGSKLKIGYTNGKQLYKRLKIFQITEEEFANALQEIVEEEKHA
ncbi:ribonuclease M5 [Bacillus sp. 2205SS5-2]|uniref:ribonuclease M5 n=1 Tax=Bacillus sp. 2205SS5-2 TaxID=3109031 RepID=UPI00300491E3